MIHVFASNGRGFHNSGRALLAKQFYGAETGKSEGQYGQSYALPVRDSKMKAVSEDALLNIMEHFFSYCNMKPLIRFEFPRLDLDLPEVDPDYIRKLARRAPANVDLPGLWIPGEVRVIVAGSRHYNDRRGVLDRLDNVLSTLDKKVLKIVSGCATGPDRHGELWSIARTGRQAVKMPALWNFHGDLAGPIRNGQMALYSTHLVAFWDGFSTGTRDMIEQARRMGLTVKVLQIPVADKGPQRK